MQVISSKDNELVKKIRRLKEKKYRDLENSFMIEGIKLIKEAIQEEVGIKTIVICEECVEDGTIDQKLLYEIAKYECIYVTKKVFVSLTEVNNPQGILAVVEKTGVKQEIDYTQDIIMVLDGLQDPGNLGTIIRTADSVALTQIVVSKETADCFNPKVVRSTMGAIFRVCVIERENIQETLQEMKKHGFDVMVTSLEESKDIYQIDYHKKAIVIGNEANGVSKEVMNLADEKIKIPMLGKTESLNASVAASIIMYEYVRKKWMGN